MQSGPHCVCVFVRRREREREREKELLQSRSINSSNGFDPSRLTAAINIKASLLCLPSSRTTLRGGVQAPVCAHVCVHTYAHGHWYEEKEADQTLWWQAAEKWHWRSHMFLCCGTCVLPTVVFLITQQ